MKDITPATGSVEGDGEAWTTGGELGVGVGEEAKDGEGEGEAEGLGDGEGEGEAEEEGDGEGEAAEAIRKESIHALSATSLTSGTCGILVLELMFLSGSRLISTLVWSR